MRFPKHARLKDILTLLLLVGAFIVGREGMRRWAHSPEPATGYNESSAAVRAPAVAARLEMVLVASATCGACANPRLPKLVEAAARELARQSAVAALGFSTVGIAVDPSPEDGIDNLRRFGKFDQLIVGGGWESLGAFEYVWDRHPGQAAVPQILVAYRTVESVPTRILGVKSTVLARVVGLDELQAWARQGFLLTIPSDSLLLKKLK